MLVWHPAVQVTRALPSDFFEAEESATKPPPKPLSNGESVSIYFTLDNSHEAFLNVRQTDDWFNVKDDPVFLEFPLRDEFVPLSEVIKSRMRPDLSSGENADTKTVEDWSDSAKSQSHNVMDNLEMALQHHNNNNAVRQAGPEEVKLDAKVTESPITQNNAEQEDILARLGVTGSPKPIAEDPAHSYSAEDGASNRLDYSAYEKYVAFYCTLRVHH